MSCAYYYLIGQNINILTANWQISLILNIFGSLTIYAFTGFNSFHPFFMLIGWTSCLIVNFSELACHAKFEVFSFTHLYIFIHGLEMIAFAGISLFVFANDGNPLVWLFAILGHALYTLFVFLINKVYGRIDVLHESSYNYYLIYGGVLLSTDVLFCLFAFSDYHYFITPGYVLLVMVLTLFCSFFVYEKTKMMNNNNNNSNDNYELSIKLPT